MYEHWFSQKSFIQSSIFLEDIKHFLKCFVGNCAFASHSFVWLMVISLNVLTFYLIFRYGKRKERHSTDSGDEGGCGMTVILFSQKFGHKVELGGALLWPRNQFPTFNFSGNFSFRILWNDPHKIPNMLATSWMAILLFSKTLYLTWSHFHLFCSLMVVLSIQHRPHCFGTWKTTHLYSSCYLFSKKLLQHFETSHSIFPQFKEQFDAVGGHNWGGVSQVATPGRSVQRTAEWIF